MRLDISAEKAALLFANFDTEGNGIITESEFELNFFYITDILVDAALTELNITKANMIKVLILGTIFLSFMALFVFLGVQAFTTGTNFGAVINSLLPVLASSALYKQSNSIRKKLSKFKEAVIISLKRLRVNSAV